MARIELAPEVLDDLDRFVDHLEQFEVPDITQRLGDLIHAIEILGHSPLIGRPAKAGKRELLVGQGSRACVALYRYVADLDCVFVLAIRNQRESGFKKRKPARGGQ